MINLEKSVERILFCNESGAIAEELFDLLLRAVKPDFDLDEALNLLYPKLEHCEASRAQYMVERNRTLETLGLGQLDSW